MQTESLFLNSYSKFSEKIIFQDWGCMVLPFLKSIFHKKFSWLIHLSPLSTKFVHT